MPSNSNHAIFTHLGPSPTLPRLRVTAAHCPVMADRRGMRSGSRRADPTPQSHSKSIVTQTVHATRKRNTRSASRDIDVPTETERPLRRSARQASVTSIASESARENETDRGMRRNPREEAFAADLTAVEEVDTQLDIQDAPQNTLHRSPGAASEMSGTTAITSFSMGEAELLESRFLLRHLPKLHSVVDEFLNLLVPEEENVLSMEDRLQRDLNRIRKMKIPGSDFVEDYNDCVDQLSLYVKHFLADNWWFINIQAIHQALFGSADRNSAQTGLNLILYRANLLIMAKDMIHSDRKDKNMWTTIRAFENIFPIRFLSALDPETSTALSVTGQSALLQKTFDLALEFRTQLAIIHIDRESRTKNFDPDAVLDSVFFDESDEAEPIIRGWNTSALGEGAATLPDEFRGKVMDRMAEIRTHFPIDTQALEHGNVINLGRLEKAFPWPSVILRLLDWVRARDTELRAAIGHQRGPEKIVKEVKRIIEESAGRVSQLGTSETSNKRNSYGREGRRVSGKYSVDKLLDPGVFTRMKPTLEKASRVQVQVQAHDQNGQKLAEARVPTPQVEPQKMVQKEQGTTAAEPEPQLADTTVQEDGWAPPEDDEDFTRVGEGAGEPAAKSTDPPEDPQPLRPPQSTADIMSFLKRPKNIQKENRAKPSIFDPQPGAVRVEFGDGFDDAIEPGEPVVAASSSKQKVVRPATQSKKRALPVESDEDDDDFETVRRTTHVEQRREKARRVQLNADAPSSSTAHQPQGRNIRENLAIKNETDTSVSETDAPEMTEAAPPSSRYAAQRQQSRINRPTGSTRKERVEWTPDEEQAFEEYMALYQPNKYAEIKRVDDAGQRRLQTRTQVNLKDKARSMAINMIRSGSGLLPGFQLVIRKHTADGQKLLDQGFDW
ncbi:unnamed protein product [Periconia digitata]|uniref:Myb-like domain-containing protein n=1 Tax=Periconia digitata TaxID=1303443 RepID=A0A9W4XYN7_9PLEO|nr:unnamed protein product [Periconia digitata]